MGHGAPGMTFSLAASTALSVGPAGLEEIAWVSLVIQTLHALIVNHFFFTWNVYPELYVLSFPADLSSVPTWKAAIWPGDFPWGMTDKSVNSQEFYKAI